MRNIKRVHTNNNGPSALVGFPREVSGFATIRSLQRQGIQVTAYDCHPGSAGLYVRNLTDRYVWPDPEVDESGFVESLLRAGNKRDRPVLIDLESAAIEVIGRHQKELREHFRFVLSPSDILDIAMDKAKTAQFFADHALGAPITMTVENESDLTMWQGGFPAVFKPRRGKGGRGQHVVRSVNEAVRFWQELHPTPDGYILQEWIPGPPQNLCTVGMLCAPGGRPRALFSGQRLDIVQTRKIPEGVTSYVLSVKIPEILNAALQFAKLSGWAGMAELEFKRDERDGVYRILEINPRIWAWVQLPISCGVDFPYLYYQIATKGDCDSVFSFDEDVRYFRSILHLYTQIYRLMSGKIRLGQCLRQIVTPYLGVFNQQQRVILEDFKLRREYFRWILFYLRDSVH